MIVIILHCILKDTSRREKYIQCFIVSALRKTLGIKYYWGFNFKEKIQSDTVFLPVNEKDEIDYDYMDKYIKAIEKSYYWYCKIQRFDYSTNKRCYKWLTQRHNSSSICYHPLWLLCSRNFLKIYFITARRFRDIDKKENPKVSN